MAVAPKIISIDDDINSLKSLEELLHFRKCKVHSYISTLDALNAFDEVKADAAIVDYFMPNMSGVELMKKLHEKSPDLPVIILTGSQDVKIAVEALKGGAFHYLLKPIQADELFSTIDKIIDQLNLKEENRRLKNELAGKYGFENIIGGSPALSDLFKMLSKAVKTRSTILITGESGTGKELVAKAVHYNSSRKDGPFIKVNCAAIPETMLEAELFGIEKNVATGVDQRPGKFELSDGGSIFLDEIGDMSTTTQAKLLRVLQEREVERIGAAAPKQVDMRVIAATNMNLAKAVEEKNFRQDLLYRLNVFHLHIPPLSQRREDIELLAEHFIDIYSRENGLPEKSIDDKAIDYLVKQPWPGNIRELENVIERAVAVSEGDKILIEDVRGSTYRFSVPAAGDADTASKGSMESAVADFERKLLLRALEENDWKQNKTAEKLGISERSIWYKIKKLGIEIKKE